MSDPVSQLRTALGAATTALRGSGGETDAPPDPKLERPKRSDQGDYATNAAMLLAPVLGAPPREIAGRLGDELAARLGRLAARLRGGRPRLPQPGPVRRLAPRRAAGGARRRRGFRSRRGARAPSGSCSSSSRPTRRPCSSPPAAVTPPTATRWHGSFSTTATRSTASTTSTTPARRSAVSASLFGPARSGRIRPRTAIRASTSTDLASQIEGAADESVDVDVIAGRRGRACCSPTSRRR